jgi:hypothetical protein
VYIFDFAHRHESWDYARAQVPYIANPRTLIDEAYLTQEHILKKGPDDSLVFLPWLCKTDSVT